MDSISYTPLEQWQQLRRRLITLSEGLLAMLEALEMPALRSEVQQLAKNPCGAQWRAESQPYIRNGLFVQAPKSA